MGFPLFDALVDRWAYEAVGTVGAVSAPTEYRSLGVVPWPPPSPGEIREVEPWEVGPLEVLAGRCRYVEADTVRQHRLDTVRLDIVVAHPAAGVQSRSFAAVMVVGGMDGSARMRSVVDWEHYGARSSVHSALGV